MLNTLDATEQAYVYLALYDKTLLSNQQVLDLFGIDLIEGVKYGSMLEKMAPMEKLTFLFNLYDKQLVTKECLSKVLGVTFEGKESANKEFTFPQIYSDDVRVDVKKVKENAIIPKYQTVGAAGFDFCTAIESAVIIPPEGQAIIPTGLAMAIPEGYEIQVRPRSGNAAKYSVTITNSPGTIDSDFRGEIMAIVINHGEKDFVVMNGDRIAQGVLKRVERAKFVEVNSLDATERGQGGFGSTGTK